MNATPGPTTPGILGRLHEGDPATLDWLRRRCEQRAAPRFSAWAWEWAREDFVGDLAAQLVQSTGRPGFALRGPEEAYIDRSIANLCRRWFWQIARLRRQRGEELAATIADAPRSRAPERIAVSLDLREAMAQLDERCRSLLLRKYVEGLTLEQLGQQDGVAAKTARSRLHSCRQRFRALWEKLAANIGDRPRSHGGGGESP